MHEGYYGKKKYLILYMKEYEYIDRREYYKNNREKILIYQKNIIKKIKKKLNNIKKYIMKEKEMKENVIKVMIILKYHFKII